MELMEYVKLVTAFVVSIGGSSVVIVALAKFFGGFISTRLLDSYNNKHEKELEEIKNKYSSELEKTNDVNAAAYLGTVIAKRAMEKGIKAVVFDRGGYIYQGKVAALAEAAREAGLEF